MQIICQVLKQYLKSTVASVLLKNTSNSYSSIDAEYYFLNRKGNQGTEQSTVFHKKNMVRKTKGQKDKDMN